MCNYKSINNKKIEFVKFVVNYQIDKLGMHKSYNLLEHSKFINNLNEIKNIYYFLASINQVYWIIIKNDFCFKSIFS